MDKKTEKTASFSHEVTNGAKIVTFHVKICNKSDFQKSMGFQLK